MSAIHKGVALDDQGAYSICRSQATTVVALLGPVGCGKTTLIAALHQAFLHGPVGDYGFRRSATLVGFEERCFNSRVTSGGDRAVMPRTSYRVGREYYHLGLSRYSDKAERDLLLLDMSGEYYERAVSNRADAEQLVFLKHVSRLALILDGEKLASTRLREKVFTDAKMLLRRFDEEGQLLADTPLQIIVSKLDRLVPDEEPETILRILQGVKGRFTASTKTPSISILGVAASPLVETIYPLRYGMAELLSTWLEATKVIMPPSPKVNVNSQRIAGRLATAWLPESYV